MKEFILCALLGFYVGMTPALCLILICSISQKKYPKRTEVYWRK